MASSRGPSNVVHHALLLALAFLAAAAVSPPAVAAATVSASSAVLVSGSGVAGMANVAGIATDHWSDDVFVTDSPRGSCGVDPSCPGRLIRDTPASGAPGYTQTVIDANLSRPTGVAVAPVERLP